MDSISNMLIILKNGSLAGKESVLVPYSKMKHAILESLKKEGYISDVSKKVSMKSAAPIKFGVRVPASGGKNTQPTLEVGLIYVNNKPKITDVERISKQSRRVYFGMKDIHSVRNGSGLLVLSTPKGILAGDIARREHVGGEALFRIW